MESLTATNALMKEDLAMAKNALLRTQDDNRHLLAQLEKQKSQPRTNNKRAIGAVSSKQDQVHVLSW